tara:strand:+ start:27228 stop:29153 length:1926 start_codon:yes stop_codon:yes gene_type:complete
MESNPNIAEDIKSKITLSEVIQKYVSWDKRKTNMSAGIYWSCCPFHSEKTASFRVDNTKNYYYCFGCQATGDLYKFLMEIEKITFPEALERMANISGVKLPEKRNFDPVENKKREIFYEINNKASEHFSKDLFDNENSDSLKYLIDRGLSKENILFFKIGLAKGKGGLIKLLESQGFNKTQMVDAGLVIRNDKDEYYERFRNRIIFPIADTSNKIIAFGARDLSGKSQAKYINSPETSLFQKKNVIYNFYNAKISHPESRELIVTEGYFDAITLSVNGYKSAVSTMGTSISIEQINRLWQISKEPLLCFDGDSAGKKAAIRIIELIFPILKPGYSMNFLFLPDSMDPDELVRKNGKEAIRDNIRLSINLIDLLWMSRMDGVNYETPEKRAQIETDILNVISTIKDSEVKKHYKYEIMNRLNAFWKSKSFESNKVFFKTSGSKNTIKKSLATKDIMAKKNSMDERELLIIASLIEYPVIAKDIIDEIISIEFKSDDLNKIKKIIVELLLTNGEKDNLTKDDIYTVIRNHELINMVDKIETYDLKKTYRFLHENSDPMEAKVIFSNILSQYTKSEITRRDLEHAKANYIQDPNDENLSKLTKIRHAIESMLNTDNIPRNTKDEMVSDFDKWYEANKDRLHKKE